MPRDKGMHTLKDSDKNMHTGQEEGDVQSPLASAARMKSLPDPKLETLTSRLDKCATSFP